MLPVGEGVCNMPSSTACDEESELGNNSVCGGRLSVHIYTCNHVL